MSGDGNPNTKDRILDVTEQLYAEHGAEALSLRTITQIAHVNLAAVSYHFHSKENLVEKMLLRRLAPIHAERLMLLQRVQHHFGAQLSTIHVLAAILIPTVQCFERQEKSAYLQSFYLRVAVDPSSIVRNVMKAQFAHVSEAVERALLAVLPSLSQNSAAWKIGLFFNALPGTVVNHNTLVTVKALLESTDSPMMNLLTHLGSVWEIDNASQQETGLALEAVSVINYAALSENSRQVVRSPSKITETTR